MTKRFVLSVILTSVVLASSPLMAQDSTITYQGQLRQLGQPFNGTVNLEFRLYDQLVGGSQIGPVETRNNWSVADGLFQVELDFGAGAFSADPRFLEIRVDGTALTPRQAVRPVPVALFALNGNAGSNLAQVVTVAKSGGDFTSIQAALDSISDASPSKPYLVYVAPGVYTERVTLKSYVTVEGAGEWSTILRWTGGVEFPSIGSGSATLVGATGSNLLYITVESSGEGNDVAVAIQNDNTAPTFRHVTAVAFGASGVNYGFYNANSAGLMANVDAAGIGGVWSFGVYNENSIPQMTNVSAKAQGGSSNNYGVHNAVNSSPVMTNIRATATGDGACFGVYNIDSSSPVMTNVTASAAGASTNRAVYNNESSPQMTNVFATALGGTSSYGLSNFTSSSPTIRDSKFEGSTNSIVVAAGSPKVANSQLIGPVSSGLTCFNNYDENLDPVVCP